MGYLVCNRFVPVPALPLPPLCLYLTLATPVLGKEQTLDRNIVEPCCWADLTHSVWEEGSTSVNQARELGGDDRQEDPHGNALGRE